MKKLMIMVVFLLVCFVGVGQNIVTEKSKSITKAYITTIVDGFDVQKVNLWSSVNHDRVPIYQLRNKEKVIILQDKEPYYLIKIDKDNGQQGYCMKGFVVKIKKN